MPHLKPIFRTGVIATVALTAGCGAAPEPTPDPPPEAYTLLAETLAGDLEASRADFPPDDDYETAEREFRSTLTDLDTLRGAGPTGDPKLDQAIMEAAGSARELRDSVREMKVLPKPSDGRFAVKSFLHGLSLDFGGAGEAYQVEEDRRAALRAELTRFVTHGEDYLAVVARLPEFAAAHAPADRELPPSRMPAVDFDAAWRPGEEYDWLTLTHRGPPLTNCTLRVTVTGEGGDAWNVHFARELRTGAVRHARYEPWFEWEGRRISVQTVPAVRAVRVELWCDQGVGEIAYAYDDDERAADVRRACEELDVAATYLPFEDGYVWDDQRGVRVTLRDGFDLGRCDLKATFVPSEGDGPPAVVKHLDGWSVGESHVLRTGADQLPADPGRVVVELAFPDTVYRHRVEARPRKTGG